MGNKYSYTVNDNYLDFWFKVYKIGDWVRIHNNSILYNIEQLYSGGAKVALYKLIDKKLIEELTGCPVIIVNKTTSGSRQLMVQKGDGSDTIYTIPVWMINTTIHKPYVLEKDVQVGDKVKIIPYDMLDLMKEFGSGEIMMEYGMTFNSCRHKFCGKTATVTSKFNGQFELDIDGGKYAWTALMFEKVIKNETHAEDYFNEFEYKLQLQNTRLNIGDKVMYKMSIPAVIAERCYNDVHELIGYKLWDYEDKGHIYKTLFFASLTEIVKQ